MIIYLVAAAVLLGYLGLCIGGLAIAMWLGEWLYELVVGKSEGEDDDGIRRED